MDTDAQAHLERLLAKLPSAMLVTRSPTGELRARPMAVTRKKGDPTLWFAARFDSAKVAELVQDPVVNVAFQGGDAFVSISGTAKVVQDRTTVRALWQDGWKLWFPDGPDEPELVLVQVTPTTAELWDLSGAMGLRFVFDALRALWRGEEAKAPPGAHEVIDERRAVSTADQPAHR